MQQIISESEMIRELCTFLSWCIKKECSEYDLDVEERLTNKNQSYVYRIQLAFPVWLLILWYDDLWWF